MLCSKQQKYAMQNAPRFCAHATKNAVSWKNNSTPQKISFLLCVCLSTLFLLAKATWSLTQDQDGGYFLIVLLCFTFVD